jgi:hypothetical protein
MPEFFTDPENRPPSHEEIKKALTEALPSGVKINMDNMETFASFLLQGGFIHSLPYIDDPLFLYSASMTIGLEDEELAVKKVPATLTGYLLYDKDNHPVGFTCFESQIKKETE